MDGCGGDTWLKVEARSGMTQTVTVYVQRSMRIKIND